jgi:hypothetical protein
MPFFSKQYSILCPIPQVLHFRYYRKEIFVKMQTFLRKCENEIFVSALMAAEF